MHYLLAIPGLISIPTRYRDLILDNLSVAGLNLILSRGTIRKTSLNFERWLGDLFLLAQEKHLPVAPFTYEYDGGTANNEYLLRADPVHLQINRDSLMLIGNDVLSISLEEASMLTATLNKHFAELQLNFKALHPKRWYISYPDFSDLNFYSIRQVAGKSIDGYLPLGLSENQFRSLFNEIQMVLFQHPVNTMREERGELPINSIWFWGGGRSTKLTAPNIDSFWSNDWSSLSLAAKSTIRSYSLPANARFSSDMQIDYQPDSTHVVILNDLESWASYGDIAAWKNALIDINDNWLVPMLNEIRKGSIRKITLVGFGDDESVEIELKRSALWKFWKRPRTLKEILASNA